MQQKLSTAYPPINEVFRANVQLHNFFICAFISDVVLFGIGFHHAGLDLQDRKIIEQLFLNGELPVLGE